VATSRLTTTRTLTLTITVVPNPNLNPNHNANPNGQVDKDGYALFGFILFGAEADASLSLASVQRSRPHTREACRAAAEAHRPRGPLESTVALALQTEPIVRLCRLTGLQSFWMSEVNGAVHSRAWGLLGDPSCYSTTLDFGPGGDLAAEISHAQAARSKLTPARQASERAYRVLDPQEPFPVVTRKAKGKRTRDEAELDKLEDAFRVRCEFFVRGDGTLEPDEDADADDEADTDGAP
jgi:hypothetical protein